MYIGTNERGTSSSVARACVRPKIQSTLKFVHDTGRTQRRRKAGGNEEGKDWRTGKRRKVLQRRGRGLIGRRKGETMAGSKHFENAWAIFPSWRHRPADNNERWGRDTMAITITGLIVRPVFRLREIVPFLSLPGYARRSL